MNQKTEEIISKNIPKSCLGFHTKMDTITINGTHCIEDYVIFLRILSEGGFMDFFKLKDNWIQPNKWLLYLKNFLIYILSTLLIFVLTNSLIYHIEYRKSKELYLRAIMHPKHSDFFENFFSKDNLLCHISLITCKEMINQPNEEGYTAIQIALQKNLSSKLVLLLENGADPNIYFKGEAPLEYAINRNMHHELFMLLRHNASTTTKFKTSELTPIILSTYRNNIFAIKEIAKDNRTLIETDLEKMTPLHIAAIQNQTNIVEYLLGRGCNPNVTDIYGRTPYYIASKNGDFNMMYTLQKYDADPNITNSEGEGCLHAAIASDCLNCVKMLIDLGLDVNASAKDNFSTPAFVASEWGRTECLKLIKQKNGTVDAKQYNGFAPIHIAAANGHLDIIKELKEEGADLRAKCGDMNAIMFAAWNGNAKAVNLLNSYNVGMAFDSRKRSALHYAAESGDYGTVYALIMKGYDRFLRDEDGITPGDIAQLRGHKGLMPLFNSSWKI